VRGIAVSYLAEVAGFSSFFLQFFFLFIDAISEISTHVRALPHRRFGLLWVTTVCIASRIREFFDN